ncbi:MAG: serine hydrolase [Sphaerochaetaceae bacterium]|nr:serine hydrolase [Sphaerochaetaceae bacterium]MDC7237644.1 serine hydrolase [Sphaerochaetaceae bacterium]MDC7250712.1 serine hydrolase [Sphaerochaetaceae bacterium]
MLNYKTINKDFTNELIKNNYIKFINSLKKDNVELHSFTLIHNEKLLLEKYSEYQSASDLHQMYSITKNLTSIAIGILITQNKINLVDKISSYFKDKINEHTSPEILDMKIEDLLSMRTCYNTTTYKKDLTKDWLESFFTSPIDHKSGTIFSYDTSASHTLCALVERITNQKLLDFLNQNLNQYFTFSKNSFIKQDPFGNTMGGTGFNCTTKDLINLALFLYQEGKGVLSNIYFKEATSKKVETTNRAQFEFESYGYGYQFWKTINNGYFCYGMDGQLIIIIPQLRFIAITTANTKNIQILFDNIFKYFLYPLSTS